MTLDDLDRSQNDLVVGGIHRRVMVVILHDLRKISGYSAHAFISCTTEITEDLDTLRVR